MPMLVNSTQSYRFVPVDKPNSMCYCDISSPCTRPQGFYCQSSDCHQINSTPNQTIPGLLLGCYTYESFSLSTLECLYDQTCIEMLIDWRLFDYMHNYLPTNFTNITALSLDVSSWFSPLDTMDNILIGMFVKYLITSSNYTAFYDQCQPTVCTYTMTERYQLIYIVTSVIGLAGGLTVILRILIPPTVKIARSARQYYRQRRQMIQPGMYE